MTDTPNRPPLSPAAQAVMDAFGTYPLRTGHIHEDLISALAAAVRAVADQCAEGATHWELYAIAAELEGRHG